MTLLYSYSLDLLTKWIRTVKLYGTLMDYVRTANGKQISNSTTNVCLFIYILLCLGLQSPSIINCSIVNATKMKTKSSRCFLTRFGQPLKCQKHSIYAISSHLGSW